MRKLLIGTGLLLAVCSAFFSVTGIGLLFHGASVSVMVMAASLEIAKLVSAAYLKRAWHTLGALLKAYLTIAVLALMLITSIGIYGFLSDAFQKQRIRIQQVDRQVAVIQGKLDQNESEIKRYTSQVSSLTQVRNTQEESLSKLIDKDKSTARITALIKSADAQITIYSRKIDSLNEENTKHIQSISDVKDKNIDLEEKVGGFRFVADAFNIKIETAVKWLILLIVLVFDPMAIALILAYNNKRTEEKDMTTTTTTTTSTTSLIQRALNAIKKKIDAESVSRLHELERNYERSSQFGEEAFIEHILAHVGTDRRYLVELLDYGEKNFSNFDYLLRTKGYEGVIISPDSESPHARNHVVIVENVIPLMRTYRVPEVFDALSIDLNGNDYWVLDKVLSHYRPNLVIAEFNASRTKAEAIKYNPSFRWGSDDYYGFSFEAAKKIASRHGYRIIFQNDELNLYMVAEEHIEGTIPECKATVKNYHAHNPHGEWVEV